MRRAKVCTVALLVLAACGGDDDSAATTVELRPAYEARADDLVWVNEGAAGAIADGIQVVVSDISPMDSGFGFHVRTENTSSEGIWLSITLNCVGAVDRSFAHGSYDSAELPPGAFAEGDVEAASPEGCSADPWIEVWSDFTIDGETLAWELPTP